MGIAPSVPTEEGAGTLTGEMLDQAYANVKKVADNIEAIQGVAAAFVSDVGFTVIKHKKAGANTYARTAAEWMAVGGAHDANVFHYIDPALDAGLIAGTNTVDLHAMLTNAVAALHPTKGGQLLFPAGFSFRTKDQLLINKPKIVLAMHGATLDGDYSERLATDYRPVLGILADDCALLGGTIQESGNHPNSWQLEVTGKRLTIEGTHLTKPNRTVGGSSYQAYFRYGADGVMARGLRTSLADGIFIESSNNKWIGCDIECEAVGGDDSFVLKAIQGITENNVFIGCNVKNGAAIVSFGSEVGVADPARDAAHSRQIRGTVIDACTGTNCASLVLFKPGAVDTVAYGDGWIHSIKLNNNTLIDMTGAKLALPICFYASRGCWISDISGDNNRIIGRSVGTEATGHKRPLDIWALEYVAGWQPKIWGIDLGFEFHDPYNGVAAGGAAPGHPFEMIGSVVDDTAAGNAISDIRLRIKGNGCRASGFFIGDGLDNAVTFEKVELTNTCTAAIGGTASLHLGSIAKADKYSLSPNTVVTFASGALKYVNLSTAIVPTGSVLYRKAAGDGLYENQPLATLKADLGLAGVNSGDQNSIVGISGTLAQFNAAITDGNIPQTPDDLVGGADLYRVNDIIPLDDGGTGVSLADPGADRIMFFDDSAGQVTWLSLGPGLSIAGTVLSATGATLADGDYGDVNVTAAGTAMTVQGATGAFVVGGHCQLNDAFRVSGTTTTPTSGAGVEVTFATTLGRISCIERVGAGNWLDLQIRGLTIDVRPAAVSVGVFSTTGLAMSQPITVPDETYGVGWNEDLSVPTKKAIYDKIGSLTKNDVGLNNVDNTSDADKPVSTATAAALAGKADARPAITTPSASFAAADADNNEHMVASGAGTPTLTLGNITPGTSFSVRFTTAWALACAGGLSKNGAAAGGVTTGNIAANSLVTFVHEGAGVWTASGNGLT